MADFTLPFPASSISSHFGPRRLYKATGNILLPWAEVPEELWEWQEHDGLDYRQDEGTEIPCVADGTVELVTENDDDAGFSAWVSHGTGAVISTYSHLAEQSPLIRGQKVHAGEIVGRVGNTGNSTDPHLHLGVLVRGVAYNPLTIESKWDYYRSVDYPSTE